MPNDQFGRPVSVGDTVTIKGEVVTVLDNPNYVNCTVKLAQQMPPAGTETNVQLNTAQVEKQGGGSGEKGGAGKSSTAGAETPPRPPEKPLEPPPPHGAKK